MPNIYPFSVSKVSLSFSLMVWPWFFSGFYVF